VSTFRWTAAETARNLRFREPVRRRGKPRLRVIVYSRRSSVSCAGLGPALAVFRLTLASRRSHANVGGVSYAVSPDGQRFVVLEPIDREAPVTHLDVVLNWFSDLKQKAGAAPK
jgi:hypothetical protein